MKLMDTIVHANQPLLRVEEWHNAKDHSGKYTTYTEIHIVNDVMTTSTEQTENTYLLHNINLRADDTAMGIQENIQS